MKKIKIHVIAPASRSTTDDFSQALNYLKRFDFEITHSKEMNKGEDFFAAPYSVQWRDLQKAVKSNADIIWSLRGGYGSMRLIDDLMKLEKPKKEKVFIGFSDVTALHIFFQQKWNWKTLHAPNFNQMHPGKKSEEEIIQLINTAMDFKNAPSFEDISPLNKLAVKSKLIEGKLTGGNLRLVETSIGTNWQIKTNGKILFLEDTSERGYAVHRMLIHLIQAKVITDKTKAVVFGQFTGGNEPDGSNVIVKALELFAKISPCPVFAGLPCGHGEPNWPIILGVQSKLINGKLSYK